MKKRILLNSLLLLFSFVLIISSCEKDDVNPGDKTKIYSSINVPDKIGVIPPKSLNTQNAGSLKNTATYESEAYRVLTEEIDFVRHYMVDAEIEMMMLDQIFDDIMDITGGQSGSVPVNSLKITYTQQMENKIDSLYPGLDINIAGKEETVPALDVTIYNSDNEGNGYKYEIVYDKSWSTPGAEAVSYTMSIKWSSDKNQVQIKRDKTLTLDIPPSPTVTISSIVSTYNALDNTMSLNVTQETNQELSPKYSFDAFNIIMKETSLANNEIFYDSRSFHVDEITEVVINKKIARADNSSGSVKIDFYNWAGAAGYKESFDATGTILSQSSSENGIIWTGDAFPDDFTSYVLTSPNLTLSGFNPVDDKIFCFVVLENGAPSYNSNPVGFLSSIIGFIVYEKSPNINAITDSYNWESINAVSVYEFNNEYIETGYLVFETLTN